MSAETYSLLWSKKSNCFHIEPLDDTVSKGIGFMYENKTNDYLLIGYGTYEAMSRNADRLRPILIEREE
jgi:hypothetical protein